MKVMYGYSIIEEDIYIAPNSIMYSAPSLEEAVAELMKDIEHTSYSISRYEYDDDGQHCVDVRYLKQYAKYASTITIYCNVLLEIEGKLFCLPPATKQYRYIKSND